MSSKSKRRPRRVSTTEVKNRHLLVFLWALSAALHPSYEQLRAVTKEFYNVCESIERGGLPPADVVAALRDEGGIVTDWQRRERG